MLEIPDDLQYTDNHEWVLSDGTDAIVGVSSALLSMIGEVRSVELPAVDQPTRTGRASGYLHGALATHTLSAPLHGVVTAINPRVLSDPSTIDLDPYRSGWLFKIRLDPRTEPSPLRDAEAYRGRLEQTGTDA